MGMIVFGIICFFAGIGAVVAPAAFMIWRAERLLDETASD